MKNSEIWSVVLALAVLAGGCGKGTKGPPALPKTITNSIGMKFR